jgi:antitoxin HicB
LNEERPMAKSLEEYLALPYRLEIVPDEHGGYVVRYPELPGCMTQVERLDDAIPMAHEILTAWLEVALEDGVEVPLPRQPERHSGKFLVRMPKALHRRLAEGAEREGVSLNSYVTNLLDRGDAVARIERRLDNLEGRLDSIHERPHYDFAGVSESLE